MGSSKKKKEIVDGIHRVSRRLSAKFAQSMVSEDELEEAEAAEDVRRRDKNELETFNKESRALLITPSGASHNYDTDESSLATLDKIRETRIEKVATQKARKKKALRRLKLDEKEMKRIKNKETKREEWEKHYNQRQNRRYWRHRVTGITKWERPYVSLDINGEDDSTDESLYGGEEDGSDSSDASSVERNKKQGAVRVDHGVWVEKYNRKYDTKYWRNKDTKVLTWSKPPRAGVSPTKLAASSMRHGTPLKKVPVTAYIYLKDDNYIETNREMRERLAKEWKEKWSEEWDLPYYKHIETHELRWEDPRLVPGGEGEGPADDLDQEEAKEARRQSMSRQSMNFLLGKKAGTGYDSSTGTEDETATELTESGTKNDTSDESNVTFGDRGNETTKMKGKLIGGVWRKKFNRRWQCHYYKNTISGETTWEEPL